MANNQPNNVDNNNDKSSPSSYKSKTFRFHLKLNEPTAESYSEFNYAELVKAEKVNNSFEFIGKKNS